jgi:hypothetical protein
LYEWKTIFGTPNQMKPYSSIVLGHILLSFNFALPFIP